MKNPTGLIAAFVLLSTFPANLNAQGEYRQGLVLHYTFDKKKSERVVNEKGEQHVGRPKDATFVKEKESGRSLRVKKNHLKTGFIETKDHEDFNSSKFTVAAWIKLEQTNSNGSVVCKHDWHRGGARGFVLRCYDGKRLNFTVGAGGWLAAVGKSTIPANEWVHAAATFDGKKAAVYFNGKLDGTKVIEKEYTPSTYPLRIGHAAFSLDTHRKFDGKIDDVMFWNRTLTAPEILTVYKNQKDSRPPPLMLADIKELLDQLGSKSFRNRNSAQENLIELGTEVLPLLDEVMKTDDLEINVRIKQIKQAIKKNTWPERTP